MLIVKKARFTIVLGDTELENGKGKLKNMQTGEQTEIELVAVVAGLQAARELEGENK